jgi:O-antigen/teichoic acid export membrane protein
MLRNSLYMMATTVVTASAGYVYWAVAAHFYPAWAVGLNSALIAALTLTSTVAAVGFGPALVSALPKCTSGHERIAVLRAYPSRRVS